MPATRKRKGRVHSNTKRKKGLPTQPDIPQQRENIKPGNDFYHYVNANWLRHVNMPPYLSSYGVSEEIEDGIDAELMNILDSAREIVRKQPDKNIPYTTYLLGTLTESALNKSAQDLNVKFLKKLVSGLNCIRDTNDIGITIGEFIRYRIKSVFYFLVVPSATESTIYRLAIGPGDLGLPDPSYYTSEEGGNMRIISAYSKLLKELSEYFDFPGLETIIAHEKDVADAILEARVDDEIMMSGSELQHTYTYIPWEAICKASVGLEPEKLPKFQFLILSKKWLSQVNKWFKHLTLDMWKIWLATYIILHTLPLLPPPFDNIDFELFGKRLRGQSEKMPQKRLALRMAQDWLRGTLGEAFVKEYVPHDIKEKATYIAEEIRNVAKDRVLNTEWLEPKTRKIAMRKVENIYLGIAYPSRIPVDKKTKLNPEQLVANVLQLGEIDFKDEIEKINTRLRPENWEDAIFAVNAFYYNEGNRLILPAGILRWPFFHTSASDGWNFGGIGATIGHEITHAFDNDGKDYDSDGNRNPWWSKKEYLRYREKANALIKLYSETEYFGRHLNGYLTLSENIADLGGLSIALSALKKRLKKRNASTEEWRREVCDFFISFAVSWRTKEKKKKAMQSLFMDVHSPAIARVNNIVCQFDDWYECFNVKPGDILYKAPKDRIRIF